ncbi:hypothetical protein RRG08_040465 [Elysia crispata]|uniref:Uncharacterized protein n=1 Tax=Elysia crispata TaxID=231223 RepID=A0AAE0ZDV1_9GAST|nr:hypothetical protein RRG08_040465 [Elysia crispata]
MKCCQRQRIKSGYSCTLMAGPGKKPCGIGFGCQCFHLATGECSSAVGPERHVDEPTPRRIKVRIIDMMRKDTEAFLPNGGSINITKQFGRSTLKSGAGRAILAMLLALN